ncbi:methyl-accepting chemotaxis protein [Lederbergia citrisecunda]|uniref:methyl-accepting chemotaxis protein n=1 Tax=Lederbergia citrisecunda TaxID=2833583 RepID=UPI003D29D97D
MFTNIRTKLISAFTLILIIPAVSIGFLSYNSAKNAVENQIMGESTNNIGILNTTINNTLTPKINDIETLSEQITAGQYDGKESMELRRKLAQYAELHPEILSIYVGTEKGNFVQEPIINDTTSYDPRTRDWYKQSMEHKGEVHISKPYEDATEDAMVVTISKTTKDNSGVISVDITLDLLDQIARQVHIGKDGYTMLLDEDMNFISHPTSEAGTFAEEDFYQKMYEKASGHFDYLLQGDKKFMTFVTNELSGWKIGGTLYESEMEDAAAPILKTTMIVIVLALIVGVFIVYFVIRSVLRPIKDLRNKAITISNGDLTEEIVIRSKDEIGQLGHAFRDMQDSLKNLIGNIEKNTEFVAASSEQLTASAEQTTYATEHVAAAIQEVAGNAENQMNSIEKNVQLIGQVTEGIAHIAERSLKVSELAIHTITQAEIGGQAVSDTVNQMSSIQSSVFESNRMISSLSERSKEVGTILNVITGIAEQTNLLSLNAAIEAARAGEHGKGFAVVADEVRKLAEQSQQSASEIHNIIQGIQQDTESSVNIMAKVTEDVKEGMAVSNEAIEKFQQILDSTQGAAPQMDAISETAQTVQSAIQEVNDTANELENMAKSNASSSEEVAASTEEQLASMEEITASAKTLSHMAEELQELISNFKH